MDRSIPERRNAAATVKDEAQIAKLTEQDWSNVVSLCSERYHQNPRKLWERLWYRISRFLKLSRKINAINRLTGDPYGRGRMGEKPTVFRHFLRGETTHVYSVSVLTIASTLPR